MPSCQFNQNALCPILSVILSEAQRSRRTCGLQSWRKGRTAQTFTRGPFLFTVHCSLFTVPYPTLAAPPAAAPPPISPATVFADTRTSAPTASAPSLQQSAQAHRTAIRTRPHRSPASLPARPGTPLESRGDAGTL